MESITNPPTPEILLLDITNGPGLQLLLGASGPSVPSAVKQRRPLVFHVILNGKSVHLYLRIESYYYDRFNTNAVIATARLINRKRAKGFCSQVQFHYDCVCASGTMRLTRQTAA